MGGGSGKKSRCKAIASKKDSKNDESKTQGEGASEVKVEPESGPSSSQNEGDNDNQSMEDDPEMVIDYLKMTFPGISEQSLVDVYNVSGGDLNASIDMLSEIEFDGVDLSGSLPDTLGIGDVSDSVSSPDSASPKRKNSSAEASTSSSNPHKTPRKH
ncbi:polyadenylate-binding protein-interacting protein 5-like [Abrus precatorius]|uniref:Polyadenylate-binding protein-interacting protein 5-like n=1 Tax=Abrus precatorius TaxID=3816 RepID=A0A8B8LKH4_ABRPR|nr:polyadenylate-binding protein-interacting protein 5-like [Abrus precatorius]